MATSNGLRVLCRGRHSIYTEPYGGDIKRTASSMQRAPLYLYRTVRWRHRTDCEIYAEDATLSIQDRMIYDYENEGLTDETTTGTKD